MNLISDNFQANILKPHGRNHSAFIIIRFKPTTLISPASFNKIRTWVSKMGKEFVTSHSQQCLNTERHKLNPDFEKSVCSLMLSKSGYEKMKIGEEYIPKDEGFQRGMNNFQVQLHDYDVYELKTLEKNYQEAKDQILIDAIISIAHDNKIELEKEVKNFQEDSDFKNAVHHCFVEYAFRRQDSNNPNLTIVPLGFSDGHSNRYKIKDVFETTAVKEVLPSKEKITYGSYVVFRKMSVNEEHFKLLIKSLVDDLGVDEEYAAALYMGRFRDGTPLARFSQPAKQNEWSNCGKDLDFGYDDDSKGLKCPVHAHVRAVNPRTHGKTTASIIRRGVNFTKNSVCRNEKEEGAIDGLFFISYQKSITNQFHPLFDNMENFEDAIAYRPRIHMDGDNDNSIKKAVAKKYGNEGKTELKYEIGGNALIQYHGGEYFFVPSLTFLQFAEQLPQSK